jgi:hypothetical protein
MRKMADNVRLGAGNLRNYVDYFREKEQHAEAAEEREESKMEVDGWEKQEVRAGKKKKKEKKKKLRKRILASAHSKQKHKTHKK